jgi:hypothetical protein
MKEVAVMTPFPGAGEVTKGHTEVGQAQIRVIHHHRRVTAAVVVAEETRMKAEPLTQRAGEPAVVMVVVEAVAVAVEMAANLEAPEVAAGRRT